MSRWARSCQRPPLARELLARLVPDRLRVEQDSVHVEDDCLDQAPATALGRISPSAAGPPRPTTCPTTNGEAPPRGSRAGSPATRGSGEQWRPRLGTTSTRLPPTRDRRDAAREVSATASGPPQQAEREAGASSRSSCIAAARRTATPTRGGSEATSARLDTVSPRRGARFDGDTATPDGKELRAAQVAGRHPRDDAQSALREDPRHRRRVRSAQRSSRRSVASTRSPWSTPIQPGSAPSRTGTTS